MALKGQKFNKYLIEYKEEILQKYFKGQGTVRSLAKEYGISYCTISTWLRKINHPELQIGTKRGRPKEGNIDYKERYEI